jgi:sugar-specific transcriptional regulator TrmB
MDTTILRKAGLTESQAKGYLALIEHGSLTPAELAAETGETRTNAYAICDKLVQLGLATKREGKKTVYVASHPSALEALAEKRRRIIISSERAIKDNISLLIDMFYAATEVPSARTLPGLDGIKQLHADTLSATSDIYFLRTPADDVDMGVDYFDTYRSARAAKGITTHTISPALTDSIARYVSGSDTAYKVLRTFIPPGAYTAPVEINVYDNKATFIAYGETQMATIIDSPPIAQAIRQILQQIIQANTVYSDEIKQSVS